MDCECRDRLPVGYTGRTKRVGPRGRLFGFRKKKFAANPIKEEAYTIAARAGNLAPDFR